MYVAFTGTDGKQICIVKYMQEVIVQENGMASVQYKYTCPNGWFNENKPCPHLCSRAPTTPSTSASSSAGPTASGHNRRRVKNLAKEKPEHSTSVCVFLREIFSRAFRIIAQVLNRVEHLHPPASFSRIEQIDHIDMRVLDRLCSVVSFKSVTVWLM